VCVFAYIYNSLSLSLSLSLSIYIYICMHAYCMYVCNTCVYIFMCVCVCLLGSAATWRRATNGTTNLRPTPSASANFAVQTAASSMSLTLFPTLLMTWRSSSASFRRALRPTLGYTHTHTHTHTHMVCVCVCVRVCM
jgi:hypothetical protein